MGGWLAVSILHFCCQSDLGKYKEELKNAVSQANVPAARSAIDGLASVNTPAAVDAMLAAIASIKKEEMEAMEKRKELENAERKAHAEHSKRQEEYRKVMQEYLKDRSQANMDKLSKASQEMQPYSQKYQEARQALATFMTRFKALGQIRGFAVDALAKFSSDEAIRGLIDRFKGSQDWSVRAGIAGAFEGIDREDVFEALVAQLKKEKEPTVKVAILDALASKGKKSDDMVQAVIEVLKKDSVWQIQAAALELVRKLKLMEAVEAVIEGMAKADGRLVYDFQDTLIALTGVDKGIMPDAWKAWWEQNKEAVRAGQYTPRQEEKAGENGGYTKFFGIPIKSKRVIFVLDRSGSMAQPADFEIPIDTGETELPADLKQPKGNRKIDVAKWQLKKALYKIPDGAIFNLIFYQSTFEVYKDKMIKLDKKSREDAFAYIDKLEPQGGTNIFDSLEKALAFAIGEDGKLSKEGVDTVYLLSDGMPNQGKFTQPDDIRREIKNINDNLKVVVHTILIDAGGIGGGLARRRNPGQQPPQPGQPQPPAPPQPPMGGSGGSESDEEFMKRLAEENNGNYSAVKRKQKIEGR